jgi:hypothetical protein
MKTLRWKPLRSSVKQARSLTRILKAIDLIFSGLIVLAALFVLISVQKVSALFYFLPVLYAYLIFKMAYIALKLLTEIADDTRLQLMAVAGDEYDQLQAAEEDVKLEKGAAQPAP